MTKPKIYQYIKKSPEPIKVPFDVWRLFGNQAKHVYLSGKCVSFGEDYANIEEARKAIEWYVEQLGGNVNWEK
jgi:hypothetical protein